MESIKLEHLIKTYGKSLVAVNDITLSVESGSMVGILGPNGAGKTTTAKILTGLITPDSGHAYLNGIDVVANPKAALSDVGAVLESLEFYPQLTPDATLRFLGRLRGMDEVAIETRTRELLRELRLNDRANSRIGGFSRGMKQRLAIAQALLHDPNILILDEPTSGLDPRGMAEIRETLNSLKKDGKTILMNSHLLPEVEGTCDRVAVIDRGRILLHESVEDIRSTSSSCTISIELAEIPSDDSLRRIRDLAAVASVECSSPTELLIEFTGDSRSRHLLLTSLISLGLKVSAFSPNESFLETAYLDRTSPEWSEKNG